MTSFGYDIGIRPSKTIGEVRNFDMCGEAAHIKIAVFLEFRIAGKQLPNKMDIVPVKFMNADHKTKRISGGTPPNRG